MPKITLPQQTTPISSKEVPIGSVRRVHFFADVPNARLAVTFSERSRAGLARDPMPFDGPAGIWVIEIKGLGEGSTSMNVSRTSDNAGASISVTVFTPPASTVLPDPSSNAGILSRLFIAEAISPAKSDYAPVEVEQSIRLMRRVIATRLLYPALHGAKPGATVFDIIKARGQFKGFETYPTIEQPQQRNIEGIVTIANDVSDDRQRTYNKHVGMAVAIGSATAPADPSRNGLCAWRTSSSGTPGGNTRFFKTVGGIDFYEYATPPSA